jgi:folate-binding protein YgfZ
MVSHEEYLALRRRAAIVDRSDRGRLRLAGADRRSYLQGLLTNDIEALPAGTGCYAALLTAQGRMIADMRVLETGDDVLIDLPDAVTPRVRDHLAQFIFSEDVTVEDVTETTRQYGIYGPESAATLARTLANGNGDEAIGLASFFAAMPLFGNVRRTFCGTPMLIVGSDEVGVRGSDVFVDSTLADAFVQAVVAAGGVQASAEAAEVCRVEAGRPLFGVDMDEDTIPLEAGITERAISLTKGCYVGQEIIIRVLHRGQGRVARRLVGLRIDAGAAVPSRGAVLKSGDRQIGRVTSAVHSAAAGGPIALGYVHRDFAEAGTTVAVIGTSGEQVATVVETPFV